MSAASDFFTTGVKPWVSGKNYKQYAFVISPADGEVYIRKTADGSGTTDPADDTTNYRPVSYTRTLALPSVDLIAVSSNPAACFIGASRNVVGALAVGARTNVLSVSGRGAIDYLAYHKTAGGSARLEVIVDGITVMDRTDATYSGTSALIAIGQASAGSTASNAAAEARFDPTGVQFRRSLNVWVTNTATVGSSSATVAYHLQSIA
jgi:hypothetical protein